MVSNTSRPPVQGLEIVMATGLGLLVVLWAAGVGVVELGGALAGHVGVPVSSEGVLGGLWAWHRHLGDPRAGFGSMAGALPGPIGMYLAALLVSSAGAGLAFAGVKLYARRKPSADRAIAERHRLGLATHRHLKATFGEPAPGRLVVGRPLQGGPPVSIPMEYSLGMIVAPRHGKSSSAVTHILDAPGAVLATSSKPELLLATATARKASTGEETLVYDPMGICGWDHVVRWNPIRGCEHPEVAMRRAEALMAGTSQENLSNGSFWRSAATMLLRCVLHACALEGAGVTQLREWVADPAGAELADVLRSSSTARTWLHDAELMTRQAGETLEGVALTTAVSLDCLALPRVAEICSPSAAQAFGPTEWLLSHGTLHVVAPDAEATSVAPLTAAFVDEIVMAARAASVRSPGERLHPEFRMVLDELPNICPLPRITEYVSDGGGRGVQLIWLAQSRHQLIRRFGATATRILLDATSVMCYGGGLQDTELLRDICAVLGRLDVTHRSWSGDRKGAASWSEQIRDTPVMDPAEIFALKPFEVLLVAGGVGGSLLRLVPWWERPDATALREGLDKSRRRSGRSS
jgi:type IV secretion system protein VirD4